MRSYQYNLYSFNKEFKLKIIEEAQKLADNIFLDELSGIRRERSSKTWDDMLEIIKNHEYCHFSFVWRELRDMYDIEVCTMSGPIDYFISLELPREDGDKLVKKYKLEVYKI